jgi:hypothetical protein
MDLASFSKAGVNWKDWLILGTAGINGYDFAAPPPISTVSGSDIYAKHTGLVPKPQQ